MLFSYVYSNLGYLAVNPSSGKLSNRYTEVLMSPRTFHIGITPFLLHIILVVLSIMGLSPTHNNSYMIKNVWSWVSVKECLLILERNVFIPMKSILSKTGLRNLRRKTKCACMHYVTVGGYMPWITRGSQRTTAWGFNHCLLSSLKQVSF